MNSAEPVPCDASSIIYLAKAGVIGEANKCIGSLGITPGVWEEAVVQGEAVGAPEVGHIRLAHSEGLVTRIEFSKSLLESAERLRAGHELGRGEREVLAVASDQGTLAVIDEGRASKVARSLGIAAVPTLFLPVLGFRSGGMTSDVAFGMLRNLSEVIAVKASTLSALEGIIKEES